MGGEMYGMGFSPLGGSPIAQYRNASKAFSVPQRLVAELAPRVFIAHAAHGSKTEAFASKLAASGKPLNYARQPGEWEPSGIGGRRCSNQRET